MELILKEIDPFIYALGNSTEIRILNFLLKNKDNKYSGNSILKNIKASNKKGYPTLNKLLKLNILLLNEPKGRSKIYSLNFEKVEIRLLEQIYKMLGDVKNGI